MLLTSLVKRSPALNSIRRLFLQSRPTRSNATLSSFLPLPLTSLRIPSARASQVPIQPAQPICKMTTSTTLTMEQLDTQIEVLANKIRELKLAKSDNAAIQPLVEQMLSLKNARQEKIEELKKLKADGTPKFDRAGLESMLNKRFFYAPSFGIYGGVAGLYDYGPTGCALQANILSLWRQHFVLEESMLEVDCTNLTPYDVLKTSGHADKFADYMVKDTKTGDIHRADHLIKNVLKERLEEDGKLREMGIKEGQKAPKGFKGEVLSEEKRKEYELILESLDNYDGAGFWQLIQTHNITPESGNPVTEPQLFNLMFQTSIGPTGTLPAFMRPETAQGQFLNFKKLLEFNNGQMPFASASIGRSFRNEISPRAGLLRVREFTMAEIEHYVDPLAKDHQRFEEVRDIVLSLYPGARQLEGAGPVRLTIGEAVDTGMVNNSTLGYFLARTYLFLRKIGIKDERLRFRQHLKNEMAHYAADCWDAEIESSYGWVECVGCADRSAYDLTVHSKRTNEKLVVRESLPEPITKSSLVLEVNKKTFGPAFKKDAKQVQAYFDTLYVDDCTAVDKEWDQNKLKSLKEKLDKDGQVTIVGGDKKEYVVTKDHIFIDMRTEKIHVREYVPNVIEPSFGIGRILYSLLEHSYYVREGDEQRAVLAFPLCVAPIKCLITPISNNAVFNAYITQVSRKLRSKGISCRVDNSATSIGRRYARNDEIGTPFAITIDFQTIKDDTVTLRERDSTKQIREKIDVVAKIMDDLCEERTTWKQVQATYPEFVQQEL